MKKKYASSKPILSINKKLTIYLLLVFVFWGCKPQKLDIPSSDTPINPVTITAVIQSKQPQTFSNTGRNNHFLENDIIAISNGTEWINYSYNNAIWETTSAKSFLWENPVLSFSAYHPITEGTSMTSFSLPIDQSTLLKLSNAEYLIAKHKQFANHSPVLLEFYRRVARVVVNIRFVGGMGNDTIISDIKITSPATQFVDSLPIKEPIFVNPYPSTHQRFYALVIPTEETIAGEPFVQITTADRKIYTLNEIPNMQAGKSYTYNLVAKKGISQKLEIDAVVITDWEDDIVDHFINRHAVTFADMAKTEYYATGDTIYIKTDFKEKKKFVGWNSSVTNLFFKDNTSASTFFIMPDQDVTITANYANAPYKLEIQKPGIIADPVNPELVLETDTSFIRYYATGDRINILAPETLFDNWIKSNNTSSSIYTTMSYGGGYTKATTWFQMPAYHVGLIPTYKPDSSPYWSTQTTSNGWIEANFIERVNTHPGSVTVPGGSTFYRPFTTEEKEVIMRVLREVENTFSIAPKRTISLNFAVINLPGMAISAATDPLQARAVAGYDAPKAKWLNTDLGGRATDRQAISSKIEAVWRDQKNIDPQGAGPNNNFIGYRDGTIVVNHSIMQSWYKAENKTNISPSQIDMQSVIMHEVGHNICYYSLNGQGDAFNALDVFVVNKTDHNKSLLNKNMETSDADQAIILNELVKSYLGDYLHVVGGYNNAFDFGHLYTIPGLGVGSQYRASGTTRSRNFADFELAFLQEMGWKINPNAWGKNK